MVINPVIGAVKNKQLAQNYAMGTNKHGLHNKHSSYSRNRHLISNTLILKILLGEKKIFIVAISNYHVNMKRMSLFVCFTPNTVQTQRRRDSLACQYYHDN